MDPVRTTASPWPGLPSAEAKRGKAPSPRVTSHVVALAHPDQQRVGVPGADREPVAVGDGQPVTAQGDPERGVGAGVDDPDADPLPGSRRSVDRVRWRLGR